MAWAAVIGGVATLGGAALSNDGGKPSWESRALMDEQRRLLGKQDQRADQLWEFNQRNYMPREAEFLRDAFEDTESPEEAAARATADVRLASKNAKDAGLRDARALGIDPSSGGFQALETSRQIGEVGLEAASRRVARHGAKDRNFQRKHAALSLGRGLPSTAGALTGSASSMASSLLNNQMGLDAARADFQARRGEAMGEGIGMIVSGVSDWYKNRNKTQTSGATT